MSKMIIFKSTYLIFDIWLWRHSNSVDLLTETNFKIKKASQFKKKTARMLSNCSSKWDPKSKMTDKQSKMETAILQAKDENWK